MALLLLVASYALDWALLVVFAALGYVVGNVTPNKRPFYVGDPDIDFPYKGYDTVTLPVLFVVAVVVPAVVIFVLAIIVTPAQLAAESKSRSLTWRRKLWEWHAGWLGLALSVVTAWFISSGMKNLLGKPRPNLLGRCQPDTSDIAKYFVGAAADAAKESRLVSASICQNTSKSVIDEGFRSFPSGHSTIAAAGLVYFALFLAAKLGAGSPFLPYNLSRRWSSYHDVSSAEGDQHTNRISFDDPRDYQAGRTDGSAPPLYALIITLIPLSTALFIACSRWYDFQHHGFDIISGFAIGTATSILAFRYYHLPLGRGKGWAWGPRSTEHAFWVPVGSGRGSAPNASNGRDDTENGPRAPSTR